MTEFIWRVFGSSSSSSGNTTANSNSTIGSNSQASPSTSISSSSPAIPTEGENTRVLAKTDILTDHLSEKLNQTTLATDTTIIPAIHATTAATGGDVKDDVKGVIDDEWKLVLSRGEVQLNLRPIYDKCVLLQQSALRLNELSGLVSELEYALHFSSKPDKPIKLAVQLKSSKWDDLKSTTDDFSKQLLAVRSDLQREHSAHLIMQQDVESMRSELWLFWQHYLQLSKIHEGLTHLWVVSKEPNNAVRKLTRCLVQRIQRRWHSQYTQWAQMASIFVVPIVKDSGCLPHSINFMASYESEFKHNPKKKTIDGLCFIPSPIGDHVERTLIEATFPASELSFIY